MRKRTGNAVCDVAVVTAYTRAGGRREEITLGVTRSRWAIRSAISASKSWRVSGQGGSFGVDVLALGLAAADEELAVAAERLAAAQRDGDGFRDDAAAVRLRGSPGHGDPFLAGVATEGPVYTVSIDVIRPRDCALPSGRRRLPHAELYSTAMRALICRAWGPIDSLTVEEIAAARARRRRGAHRRARHLGELRGLASWWRASTRRARRSRSAPGSRPRAWWRAAARGATRFKPGDRVMATLGVGRARRAGGGQGVRDLPDPAPACPSTRRARSPSPTSRATWRSAGRAGSRRARPCWCWARRAASGSPRWRSARRWARA